MAVTKNDIITNAQAIADLINAGVGRKNINELPEETSLASADFLHFWDADAAADKKIKKSNLSFTATDADAIHDNVAAEINAITAKSTPVAADIFLIEDSADSWNKKKVTLTDLLGGGGAHGLILPARGQAQASTDGVIILPILKAATISKIIVRVLTAPTGSALTLNVTKNSLTANEIATSDLSVTAGTNTASTTTLNATNKVLAENDYIALRIKNVGSTIPGSDVLVGLIYA